MAGDDRLSPWAEQSVIGSMLIDPKVVGMVVSKMTEADFTMEANRLLFTGFRDLFNRGQVADPVLVLSAVAPDDGGLRMYVLQLMDTTPTAANVEKYMEEARRFSRLSRLRDIGQDLQAVTTEEDGVQLLSRGQEIFSVQNRDDEADMDKAALESVEYLNTSPDGLPWGFPELDRSLTISGGKLVVLGGRPSDGKTALALHMAYAQSRTRKVGFFTLEDDRTTLYLRLKSAISGVPLENMLTRKLSDQDYMLLATADDEIRSHRLVMIESSGWTVAEIIARAQHHRFDVIYIDYIQMVRSDAKGRPTRYEEVSDISRKLATEARRSGITVVALAQLSRPPQKGDRTSPYMSELKESGQIEQDANVILFVWRRDETSSRTKRYLTIAKNKLGMLAQWKIVFNGKIQRFAPELVMETKQEYLESLEDIQEIDRVADYQQTFYALPENTKTPWTGTVKEEKHETGR